jgi:hypothetical protein
MALIRPRGTPAAPAPRTSTRVSAGIVDRITSPAADLDLKLVPLQPKFTPFPFIEKHGHPPHNDKNGPMCLSFHVVGHCVKDCRRSGEHIRHTPAESKRLAEYLASPTIFVAGWPHSSSFPFNRSAVESPFRGIRQNTSDSLHCFSTGTNIGSEPFNRPVSYGAGQPIY